MSPRYGESVLSDDPLEKLQDGQNDIVDVAEPAGFQLLRMVQTASPIYSNVGLPARKLPSSSYGGSRILAKVVVHAIKDRAIVTNVELGQNVGELREVLRCNSVIYGFSSPSIVQHESDNWLTWTGNRCNRLHGRSPALAQ